MLILVHAFQSVVLTDVYYKAMATKSLGVDAIMIFLSYVSYFPINDTESKVFLSMSLSSIYISFSFSNLTSSFVGCIFTSILAGFIVNCIKHIECLLIGIIPLYASLIASKTILLFTNLLFIYTCCKFLLDL